MPINPPELFTQQAVSNSYMQTAESVPAFPNDATEVLKGNAAWGTGGGGGVTPNATVGVIPFLSGASALSDSPLSRDDANTVSQKNGANNQTSKIYSSFTDAVNNEGISITAGFQLLIQAFKNGTGVARSLVFNILATTQMLFQIAGVTVLRITTAGQNIIEFFAKVKTYDGVATSAMGLAPIFGSFGLDGHNDVTRNDLLYTVLAGTVTGGQGLYRVSMAMDVNTIQAGLNAIATLNWTDENTRVHALQIGNLDLSVNTNQQNTVVCIYAGGAGSISITTNIAGGGGVGKYDMRACVEQLL